MWWHTWTGFADSATPVSAADRIVLSSYDGVRRVCVVGRDAMTMGMSPVLELQQRLQLLRHSADSVTYNFPCQCFGCKEDRRLLERAIR